MRTARFILGFACAAAFAAGAARAQDSIRVGEINSYKAQAAFLEPYRKGMELAIEEVNAAGGVNGKKLDVITRDDNANPGDGQPQESFSPRSPSACEAQTTGPNGNAGISLRASYQR